MGIFGRILRSIPGFSARDGRFELLERERGSLENAEKRRSEAELGDERAPVPVPRSVLEAEKLLKGEEFFGNDPDLITREFTVGGRLPALIVYMNGLASDAKINEFLLRPLMRVGDRELSAEHLIESVIEIAEVKRGRDMDPAVSGVLEGMTALFFEGAGEYLLLETRGAEKRAVGSAENEKTVRGSKAAFTEDMRTNITLIRRGIKKADLTVKLLPSGAKDGGGAAIVYREGFTSKALIAEVEKRLFSASPRITASGVAEQLMEDAPLMPVPQTLVTERPDRVVSHIMNGRVCVLAEGSPEAVVVPATLASLMNSPEDVYLKRPLGTLLRLVRYVGALVSVVLPGYFLALALYHQGLMTTEVLGTVIASRRMVFEPIGAEMLLLLFIFQLIREAGLRVPGGIGQAIGIIGGLIMGQAAVSAHLASSVVLIVVAGAGLGNFCIPDHSLQLAAAYLRLAAVAAAWLGGLLGLTAVFLLALLRLAGLKSFGMPFLSPLAPKTFSDRPPIFRGPIKGGLPSDGANTEKDGEL